MRATILVITLALAIAGCATGPTGEYAWPVYLTAIESITPPAGVVESGADADFTVTWINGREPFVVKWEFEGGTEQDAYAQETAGRTTTITVTLVNEGAGEETYTGTATVIDLAGDEATIPFTFTVAPAS